ncbi:hypothetical protein QQS21_003745 [Conoideocrella luteorostrata]|uniref:Cell surface protein n=1 Tax=Conoideocrella luteorostrata TaxID=1105319 RepID=A0AAJ0FV94_9HYPO|nr:hypothetical protein QQS21_003745 [Conoideocrella luteorostrata]
MRYAFVSAALVATASAHGLVTRIQGANGVTMPGLSVADGTPRDCSSNGCGSQADTAIIRDRDMKSGKASPLGRTQGNGPVDASVLISSFMGAGGAAKAPTNNGASGAAGQEDDLSQLNQQKQQRREEEKRQIDKLFGGLLGGGANNANKGAKDGGAGGAGAGGAGAGAGAGGAGAGAGAGGLAGLAGLAGAGAGGAGAGAGGLAGLAGGLLGGAAGGGGQKNNAAAESMVAATSGMGASQGLPTADEQGRVSLVFRQINQDGAGPLTAEIDPKSGGTDASAFQNAEVEKNVPGLGFGGLSLATNTDFPVVVKMPAGMTCDGKVGGAENVCVVRLRNSAAAGPFGGSAAFTQTKTARKRAVAYNLKKRMEISRQ